MTRRSWLLMALLASLWGASYMFIKVALDDGVGPVFIVFARVALGAAVLAPIAWRAGAFGSLRGLWGPIALLAAVQIVVPFLLITFGEQRIPSALAGILVASAPIFTAVLAIRFGADDDRLRGWGAAGVVVGIAGVVLLFGVDLSGEAAALLGGLMVLLAGLGYAIGALYIRHRLRSVKPVGIAAATMALSAAVTLPAAVFDLPSGVPGVQALGSLVALGAGGTGIAFLIFYTLIADLGPSRAAVVAYVAPAFAVGYGVALLGEPVTVATVAGLVLILAGSWLAGEGRAPWQRRPGPALTAPV
jgi:drug/metabolite transporter (DMT)-like permease